MNQVAAIVYAAHDAAFLRTVEASGALVYTLTREGGLRAVNGPPTAAVAQIPVRHVVWVGVPKRWVNKLGSLPFASSFSNNGGRWYRVSDSLKVVEKVREARASLVEAAKEDQAKRDRTKEEEAKRAKQVAFMSAPPLYIPQELR